MFLSQKTIKLWDQYVSSLRKDADTAVRSFFKEMSEYLHVSIKRIGIVLENKEIGRIACESFIASVELYDEDGQDIELPLCPLYEYEDWYFYFNDYLEPIRELSQIDDRTSYVFELDGDVLIEG